jgi:hypothetical protein
MSPGAHLLASWLVPYPFSLPHKERRVIALAGVAPDLDGAGWVVDRVNAWFGASTGYYEQYHHLIAHNLIAALALSLLASALAAKRRLAVFLLSLAAVHLHFLCDVLGSRGPDGDQWPIPYWLPFSQQHAWAWSGQWELSGWQNTTITISMLILAIFLGWRRRYSFVEVISFRLDRAFFKMLARRRCV